MTISKYNVFRRIAQGLIPPSLGYFLPTTKKRTRCDNYWEHDPKDFDYYISKPTIKDLPILLQKFDEEGLEVWPWIWTHPNGNGPHYVFLGVNEYVVRQIKEIRAASPQNNILVIANAEDLEAAAAKDDDPDVFAKCHCGIVKDERLELLNQEEKILMLSDERVIAFDYLIIS